MHTRHTRLGVIAAGAALIGAAACNRSRPVADDGLERDIAAAAAGGLELAPSSNRAQVVVSPIEAGPTSAPRRASPTRAAPKRTPAPAPRTTTHVAARQTPAVAPAPVEAESPPVVAPPVAQPSPTPVTRPTAQSSPHGRVYKTEGEIFRDMPWIRP
jgi:hypothetical protein